MTFKNQSVYLSLVILGVMNGAAHAADSVVDPNLSKAPAPQAAAYMFTLRPDQILAVAKVATVNTGIHADALDRDVRDTYREVLKNPTAENLQNLTLALEDAKLVHITKSGEVMLMPAATDEARKAALESHADNPIVAIKPETSLNQGQLVAMARTSNDKVIQDAYKAYRDPNNRKIDPLAQAMAKEHVIKTESNEDGSLKTVTLGPKADPTARAAATAAAGDSTQAKLQDGSGVTPAMRASAKTVSLDGAGVASPKADSKYPYPNDAQLNAMKVQADSPDPKKAGQALDALKSWAAKGVDGAKELFNGAMTPKAKDPKAVGAAEDPRLADKTRVKDEEYLKTKFRCVNAGWVEDGSGKDSECKKISKISDAHLNLGKGKSSVITLHLKNNKTVSVDLAGLNCLDANNRTAGTTTLCNPWDTGLQANGDPICVREATSPEVTNLGCQHQIVNKKAQWWAKAWANAIRKRYSKIAKDLDRKTALVCQKDAFKSDDSADGHGGNPYMDGKYANKYLTKYSQVGSVVQSCKVLSAQAEALGQKWPPIKYDAPASSPIVGDPPPVHEAGAVSLGRGDG